MYHIYKIYRRLLSIDVSILKNSFKKERKLMEFCIFENVFKSTLKANQVNNCLNLAVFLLLKYFVLIIGLTNHKITKKA